MAQILTRITLRNDSTVNWANADTLLLKGEVGVEFTESGDVKIKVGNGTDRWNALPYFGGEAEGSKVYQCEFDAAQDMNDRECIERYVKTDTPVVGDMAIVMKTFAESSAKYTAYVFNGQDWVAMDGNYDANNVILSEDITLAGDYEQVGNLTKEKTGTATFAVKGKSIAAALTEIFSKRLQPEIVEEPEASITLAGAGAKEVGTTFTPSYSVSLSSGSYTYGPETGVAASSYVVTDSNGAEASTASGSFTSFTVGDTTNYKVNVSIEHNEGAVAKDNLGDASNPEIKITAGTKTANSSAVTGYRKMFFGTLTTKPETMTSADIRSLANSHGVAATTEWLALEKDIEIPLGALRVVLAVPSAYAVSKCLDVNGFNTDLVATNGLEGPITVSVEGANGYTAIDYDVYYQDFANANDTKNTYKVTVIKG